MARKMPESGRVHRAVEPGQRLGPEPGGDAAVIRGGAVLRCLGHGASSVLMSGSPPLALYTLVQNKVNAYARRGLRRRKEI